MEKLVPYCLHLPQEQIKKIKKKAKSREASKFIRDAITVALDDSDEFSSGYNQALKHACAVVENNKEAGMIHVKGKSLNNILISQIQLLKRDQK
jgi:homoserine dehydrogenase